MLYPRHVKNVWRTEPKGHLPFPTNKKGTITSLHTKPPSRKHRSTNATLNAHTPHSGANCTLNTEKRREQENPHITSQLHPQNTTSTGPHRQSIYPSTNRNRNNHRPSKSKQNHNAHTNTISPHNKPSQTYKISKTTNPRSTRHTEQLRMNQIPHPGHYQHCTGKIQTHDNTIPRK